VPTDAEAFFRLRREALETEPYSFASSPGDDRAGSIEFVRETLAKPDQAILGAFDQNLVGIAGIFRDQRVKTAHKAHIWGVYVAPSHRRLGLGRRLVEEAVHFAITLHGVTHVHLTVSPRTPTAMALYQSLGFTTWGVEPDALKVNGILVPDHHMVRILPHQEK
jgi:ribosomal protein S18 acetylase RimI-like enzyme